MRVVFAGTPEFSVTALDALHAAGHDIAGVFTQPDRPAGRGRKLTPSAVARRAGELGLPVFKPQRLDAEAQALLRELVPEVMVVVAYGLILPAAVLAIPRHGCLAIEAGDRESGITVMRMDAGLDTGPMLLWESIPLSAQTTGAILHDALAVLGARLIVEALQRLQRGSLTETVQPVEGVTYARKLDKSEAQIRWSDAAPQIARRIRAFNPAPGAWTLLNGERLRLLHARDEGWSGTAAPGTVLSADAQGITVAAGGGAVVISELQFAGGTPVRAGQAAGQRIRVGQQFG
jgi:methionyl-tRNA formyltransferase